ncbi:MAG TPA: hypothetical protein VJQ52_04210 [Steroidobacteraceae bacterium]|nr:hypothetical protein [Steroidobacteraceae bacterium]
MRRGIVMGVALVFAVGVVAQTARAAPESYDYVGWITKIQVLDPSVPLPQLFIECNGCVGGRRGPSFAGSLVVDLALPAEQRLLHLSAADGEEVALLEAAPGHPDNKIVSQRTSDLGIGAPLPAWEIVTITANTGALAAQDGRSVSMSLRWHGEPGAARQYPPSAQNVDLAKLTPRTSWRMNLTLRKGAVVYATLSANVVPLKRRGSGGPNVDEDFNDGAAQGWTPQTGSWSAATGDLRNAANTAFTSNTIQGLALPTEFVTLTDVYLSWGANGNTAGVLFNYQNANNFYEVRLNAQGTVRLSAVVGGVRTLVATSTYPDAGVRRWHTIYVRRLGDAGTHLLIDVNGQQMFDTEFDPDPAAPGVLRGGSAGVFASWNLARFDNVLIGAPVTGVFGGKNHFDEPGSTPTFWRPETGVWTLADGYLRSSANQAASIAVGESGPGVDRPGAFYGISALIHLEWSGAGNWGGLLYDYVDAQNYREVRVSRTVPGRVGEFVLAETVNGARREVLRTQRFQSTDSREVVLTVRREGNRTIVHDDSAFSNIQVRQAPMAAPFTVGLLAAWNQVRFDDVMVDSVTNQ